MIHNRILAKPLIYILFMSFAFLLPNLSHAQSAEPTNPYDTRQTVGTILLTGLAGGVLGLSTLSFYDRPQDHIRNITFGAGVGIIAAALYLTASVAQTPPPAASNWQLYPTMDQEGRALLSMNLIW